MAVEHCNTLKKYEELHLSIDEKRVNIYAVCVFNSDQDVEIYFHFDISVKQDKDSEGSSVRLHKGFVQTAGKSVLFLKSDL